MGQLNCCLSSRNDPEPKQQCLTVPASARLVQQHVQVTQGNVTRKRDLFLFNNAVVIAKPRRGSAPCPQLCLALGQLKVLTSGKGVADNATEEEEGKATNSLVIIWPYSFCVITFQSRAVKDLWLSVLCGTPEGAERAQVTQLPSIKLLLKQLSSCKAATPLHARSLQKLFESQAQTGAEQQPPPVHSGIQGGCGYVAAGGTIRRMALSWPFGQRGISAIAEIPRSLGSDSSRGLSGQPLAALCNQDSTELPQPIQDLLAILHERGPSTEGIFRLVESECASQELREALDRGAEVHLESHSVHVLATILKDFLRKIPSKLLDIHLYEEWMTTLQKSSRQDRLDGLKQVASKLPKANLLLLKSLLTLLENISRNVDTSRMTTNNLAICVGPNLLSPAEEHVLPFEVLVKETRKVIQLVEFLTEHRAEIFEEEVACTLAKEPPAAGAAAETGEVPPVAPESKELKTHLGREGKERTLESF